jgi:RNA polymerase-binding transcription factor DksA
MFPPWAAGRVHFLCFCCGEQVWSGRLTVLHVTKLCARCHRNADTIEGCQKKHLDEYLNDWAAFHEYRESL